MGSAAVAEIHVRLGDGPVAASGHPPNRGLMVEIIHSSGQEVHQGHRPAVTPGTSTSTSGHNPASAPQHNRRRLKTTSSRRIQHLPETSPPSRPATSWVARRHETHGRPALVPGLQPAPQPACTLRDSPGARPCRHHGSIPHAARSSPGSRMLTCAPKRPRAWCSNRADLLQSAEDPHHANRDDIARGQAAFRHDIVRPRHP
jgi:hypothetical protein